MPKSIIDIEINDAAFKAFTAKFNAYQDAVKKLPKAFGQAEGKTSEMADNFATMTAAMLAQLEILNKHQRVHANIRNDADKTAKAYKDAAASIVGATKSLLKWVGIGAGVVGGAFWALDKLANGVGGQRRSAQGLGITTGQQAALGTQYGRYFDVNSNLENIANAKSDYSQQWAFGAMGINQQGKDPAQLAVEMAVAAKKIFDAGGGSQQEAQAHGLLQFYTMDELRRLHATSMKDLQASEAAYRGDVGRMSRQDAINMQWLDFGIKLHESGQVIENVFIKALTPLAPEIGKVAQAFADTAETFLSHHDLKKWLEGAADGIKHFGEYVGSTTFQTKVKSFVTDFLAVADAIHTGLVRLGIVPDSTVPAETNSAAGLFANGVNRPGGQFPAWGDPAGRAIASSMTWESSNDPMAFNTIYGKGDSFLRLKHPLWNAHQGLMQWDLTRQ